MCFSKAVLAPGANSTRATVKAGKTAISFFLRDVNPETPIYLPEHGVCVTSADDLRSYREIAESVRSKGLVSDQQRIESEPEETYENACKANRSEMCPTWLGMGRDMRIFRFGYKPEFGYWGYIEPCYHTMRPGDKEPQAISFCIGKGAACRVDITRRLEEGVLPILNSIQKEEDISYHLTAFASLEKQPLSAGRVRGTEWRAAYANTGGNMLTEGDRKAIGGLLEREKTGREEETICCVRVRAENSGAVPRYAWFKALHGTWKAAPAAKGYSGKAGFSEAEGRVFGINRLNGKPMPQPEMAILLQPGASVTVEFLVPHRPLPHDRAKNLARMDFDTHLAACRAFWKRKLSFAAQISVPEPAVDERIRAGLLHCDVAALGKEPSGDVLATIGWYSPIGSESAPIIQFFDTMGWHKLAERSIQFFLDRQREDGFMQNFARYQLETGGVLWTMGEHYRYTRDRKWAARVKPNVLKACEYLLKWRDRNKKTGLRGKGYGLQDGKVADPEDFFHSFMLNALSYIGIARSAEMLADVDPGSARRLSREARAFKRDIRAAFREAVGRSPVIPTGDGTWSQSAPPWSEYPGPLALYAEGGEWFSHGAFGTRDSLIGPLYLFIGEVFSPDEPEAALALKAHQELFTVRNAGLSQPYYCRHDYLHLRRGEVKAFLKTYYNQFTALQDRETYTFWEHYFHVSQHKTHEEGWFLMQTRWMLAMEEGMCLTLLGGAPRKWLEQGKRISVRGIATYFGPISFTVESNADKGEIRARYELPSGRGPGKLVFRLPHPAGMRALKCEGGRYCAATESVVVEKPGKAGRLLLRF